MTVPDNHFGSFSTLYIVTDVFAEPPSAPYPLPNPYLGSDTFSAALHHAPHTDLSPYIFLGKDLSLCRENSVIGRQVQSVDANMNENSTSF